MIRKRPGAAAAIAVLLFAFTLALYTRTMAPGTLMDLGDPGDLQAAAAALGVPHPTGYPLFVLIGWAWVHVVPLGTMAYRLTLLSAVFGSLAVVLTFLLALRLTGRALPSLGGAFLFGLSYTFWTQTSISEVYTLNAVFVAGVFLLLLRWQACVGAGLKRARIRIATWDHPTPLTPSPARGGGVQADLPSPGGRASGCATRDCSRGPVPRRRSERFPRPRGSQTDRGSVS